MNIEEYISIKNIIIDVSKIKLPEFKKEEKNLIYEYIEFTRHIQEIDQLFHIFKVNLNHLLKHYELMTDDYVFKKDNFDIEENDRIIINALVINYLSSAKTLVESIEVFLKERFGQEKYKEFKANCLEKIYDKKFSYRFLYHLRDFSQHGHLPVYVEYNNRCCFNLDQILNTPHFKHKGQLKKEMKNISEKIKEDFNDAPRIMFTRTLAELRIIILEIYEAFINFIYDKLIFYKKEIDNLIKIRPDIIYKSKDVFNGFVVYEINNNCMHCFDPREDPQGMMKAIKKKLSEDLIKEKDEFDRIFKIKYNRT